MILQRGFRVSLILIASCFDPAFAAPPPHPSSGFVLQVDVPAPTADKPQSKLWHAHGRWWALLPRRAGPSLWERTGDGWREHREIGERLHGLPGRADVWYDDAGATAVAAGHGTLHLYRLRFVPDAETWDASPLAVLSVENAPIESATITRDSTRRWWVATAADRRVLVWYSPDVRQWTGPLVLETGLSPDDICTLTPAPGGVGVAWSDQERDRIAFRFHPDTDEPAHWAPAETVAQGNRTADDHLNALILADGTVCIATKNSVDQDGEPQLVLRIRPSAGEWRDLPHAPRVPGCEPSRPVIMALPDARTLLTAFSLYDRRGEKPWRRDRIVAARIDFSLPGLLADERPILAPPAQFAAQINNVTRAKAPLPPDAAWLVLASDNEGRVYQADLRPAFSMR